MRLYKFGSFLLPEYDGTSGIDSEGRSTLVTLKQGVFDQDGGSFVAALPRLSHRVRIPAGYDSVELDETLRRMRRVQGLGRQTLVAKRMDGSFWQIPAKLRVISSPADADQYRCEQVISFDFEPQYPFWINQSDASLYSDEGHHLDEGLITDSGNASIWAIDSTSESFVIDNQGDMPIPKGVITITPRAGASVTNLRISNAANSKYVELTTTLDDTEEAILDLGPQACRINAVDSYSLISIPATQVDWMQLELDENNITVTASSLTGIVDITWTWQRHYL